MHVSHLWIVNKTALLLYLLSLLELLHFSDLITFFVYATHAVCIFFVTSGSFSTMAALNSVFYY